MPRKKTEIAFIDWVVADVLALPAGFRPEVEPILLDPVEPAPRQTARALVGRRGLEAIHVIAHGAPGRVSLAAREWSVETLSDRAGDFAATGLALGEGGGLPLWSCLAGVGAEGEALVAPLTAAAGAAACAGQGKKK